jgi:UPF0755 protein
LRSAGRRIWAGILLLVLAAAGWLGWTLFRPYQGYSEPERLVLLERGSGSRQIAQLLEAEGVVASSRAFYFYLALTGKGSRLKAGEYRFSGPNSMAEVADKLYRGEVFARKVTIPEGLTFPETKQIFLDQGFGTDAGFDAAFKDPKGIQDIDPKARDLEGYLFPETYLLSRGTTAATILQQMVQNFRSSFDDSMRKRAASLELTPRQAVTLASLIEKETGLDDERPLVSSVYHNRMRRGMLLECDPTVVFAAKLEGRWDGVIHRSDLELDSPYNTYRYPGLPPGPIASPGAKSLKAAVEPAQTAFFYFVAGENGRHVFSEDWEAHRAAVARYHRLASSSGSGR